MHAADIIDGLRWQVFSPFKYLCAYNTYALGWEADYVAVTRQGWANEIEVKVSLSDFRADFRHKADKHRVLTEGRLLKHSDPGYPGARPHWIRRFWFAVPADIADRVRDEMPDYCGLIVATPCKAYGRNCLRMIRVVEAPNLEHSRKVPERVQVELLRSMAFKAWDRHGSRRYRYRVHEPEPLCIPGLEV